MATRATQFRILQAALELFNEHGSAAVSSNRIAERCGISKGNCNITSATSRRSSAQFSNRRLVRWIRVGTAITWHRPGAHGDHVRPPVAAHSQVPVLLREMADLLRQDPQLRSVTPTTASVDYATWRNSCWRCRRAA